MMTRPRWRSGRRGRRSERSPRKRVMVCVGRSWERPVRRAVWRAVVPEMGVRLWVGVSGEKSICGGEGDVRPRHIAGNSVHDNQGKEGEHIRHHRDHSHELGELARRPGALEVAAAMPDCQARDGEGEDVGLDEGGG